MSEGPVRLIIALPEILPGEAKISERGQCLTAEPEHGTNGIFDILVRQQAGANFRQDALHLVVIHADGDRFGVDPRVMPRDQYPDIGVGQHSIDDCPHTITITHQLMIKMRPPPVTEFPVSVYGSLAVNL